MRYSGPCHCLSSNTPEAHFACSLNINSSQEANKQEQTNLAWTSIPQSRSEQTGTNKLSLNVHSIVKKWTNRNKQTYSIQFDNVGTGAISLLVFAYFAVTLLQLLHKQHIFHSVLLSHAVTKQMKQRQQILKRSVFAIFFAVLHATLQQNNCTGCSCPVTCVKVKVIPTRMNL